MCIGSSPNRSKRTIQMNTFFSKTRTFTAIAALITAGGLATAPSAETQRSSVKLLTANFETRHVVQVEAGDFHFAPGQVAPVHTHSAPAVGYVAKGSIIYQVEGEKPRVLNEGDAFFEPVGPRILRFDNASATEEAIFIDFNLEQEGEPFIVFEQTPTEAIDRRTLPTFDLSDTDINQVDIHEDNIPAADAIVVETDVATVGIVAEGVVVIETPGVETRRIVAGQSFALPESVSGTKIRNASGEVSAKVISFRLIPSKNAIN
ncbi:cupin domain-containing protein [Rhodobacteraceae bacterium CY05]|uniref:Cupin domain-containing protein n=2 Tax=Parasedimentitalea huanghaiensis TaxID=2682100 RepID=A0A6L6WP37_9RHOB|nr:cupin domain-containing protein [Zongyanglinia huanghaiensis]